MMDLSDLAASIPGVKSWRERMSPDRKSKSPASSKAGSGDESDTRKTEVKPEDTELPSSQESDSGTELPPKSKDMPLPPLLPWPPAQESAPGIDSSSKSGDKASPPSVEDSSTTGSSPKPEDIASPPAMENRSATDLSPKPENEALPPAEETSSAADSSSKLENIASSPSVETSSATDLPPKSENESSPPAEENSSATDSIPSPKSSASGQSQGYKGEDEEEEEDEENEALKSTAGQRGSKAGTEDGKSSENNSSWTTTDLESGLAGVTGGPKKVIVSHGALACRDNYRNAIKELAGLKETSVALSNRLTRTEAEVHFVRGRLTGIPDSVSWQKGWLMIILGIVIVCFKNIDAFAYSQQLSLSYGPYINRGFNGHSTIAIFDSLADLSLMGLGLLSIGYGFASL